MLLHGKNLIGDRRSAIGSKRFNAYNPDTAAVMPPQFTEATEAECNLAMELAAGAFITFRNAGREKRARLLEALIVEINQLGESLIERANQETGLGKNRLRSERTRTLGQIQLFADEIRDGRWLDIRIDPPIPERKPLPRPDLRQYRLPVGPVVVFGASNFPLAFSVAGGDTVAALAAGCPVVFKAHPAHPGTSEMVAGAIGKTLKQEAFPEGAFSMLHAEGHRVGQWLVQDFRTRAVAFTGSLSGGRQLFDLACRRPEPIPVFAEMGSINPIFVLAEIMAKKGEEIAARIAESVTLGTGQFCTNPGLIVAEQNPALERFTTKLAAKLSSVKPGPMVNPSLLEHYNRTVQTFLNIPGVRLLDRSQPVPEAKSERPSAFLLTASAETFMEQVNLSQECFGPATLIITCSNRDELLQVARKLPGQLTVTLQATEQELLQGGELLSILQDKAGRLLFGGVPTGVEVSPAMFHGGPYPATSNSRYTSVGTQSIHRFTRPVCFQNFPQELLPAELRDENRSGIWRLINNTLSKESIS